MPARRTQRSAEGQAYQHLYKSKRWKLLRQETFKRDNYTCQRTGELCSGTYPEPNSPTANHKIPHKGDTKLFFSPANLETVTKAVHDSMVQSKERGGTGHLKGCDARGWPTSEGHEWNT